MFDNPTDKNFKFSQVPQSEDLETLLPDSTASDTEDYRKSEKSRFSSWGVAVILFVAFCLTAATSAWLGSWWALGHGSFIERISQYSPVLKDVDVSYHVVRFNGSLLKENVFRQGAGPEVDAAWRSLGVDYRPVAVPTEEAARSGLLPDQVKVSEKYGGGYPANVEGLHHLHCLNLLRQSLYFNFDHYHAKGEGAFRNPDDIIRFHVTHCLDILRQQLMCTVDVGVLGQVWWDLESPRAYVDFNTRHKCRNFDDIRQWAEDHQLPAEVPDDFLQPPEEGDTVYAEIP